MAGPGPVQAVRDENALLSMRSVLHDPDRIGPRIHPPGTVAVALASWLVHAVALHRQLAASKWRSLSLWSTQSSSHSPTPKSPTKAS